MMLYSFLITERLSDRQVVLTDCRENYTYRDIDELSGKIECALKQFGLKRNDRVLLLAEHTVATVMILMACMRMGVCFAPIPPRISPWALEVLTKDALPALIIGDHGPNGVRRISPGELMALSAGKRVSEPECVRADTVCYILYTSGSTDQPKGVVALEKNVKFCIEAINRRLRNSASDRILCCLPLSFDYGLYQVFLALASGACLVLPPDVPLPSIISLLAKERITGFPAMPSMLNLLLKTRLLNKVNLDHMRYVTSTGDVFSIELIRRISASIPSAEILPMYGLTECKRVAVMPLNRRDKTLAGSCGLPLDGVSVWLEHPDERGVGELVVSGENVMSGYWNDLAATKTCFYFDADKGHCFRTGDIFRIDDEGYLYFVGRKKLILKVNGYRIGIIELESFLLKAMGDVVNELAVSGCPDEIMGEKIEVFVWASASCEVVIERLTQVSEALPPYQRPHFLCFSNRPLPKNANGKTDRTFLKEMALQNERIPLR